MKSLSMTTGAVLMLAIVAIGVALATKPVKAIASEPPKVLTAQLATTGGDATLKVTAQDPDSTIVGLDVTWSDGTRSTATFDCPSDDYGGKTVERTFTHRGTVTAAGTRVRASARSCFERAHAVTGPSTTATAR